MITHESGNENLESGKHSPKQAATNSSSHSPPTTFKEFSFLLSFAQFLCQPKNFHIKDHLTLIGRLWVQFSDNSKVSTHLIRLSVCFKHYNPRKSEAKQRNPGWQTILWQTAWFHTILKWSWNCPNVSTFYNSHYGNGVTAMFLSVVQLKGKHCRIPHYRNGVVDIFGP